MTTATTRPDLPAETDPDSRTAGPLPLQVLQQARRTPGAVAVEFEGDSMTYADLVLRATRVARGLRRARVRPDDVVAVFRERSLDLPVGLLGAWFAGATTLALDPRQADARLRTILDTAQARWVVTDDNLLARCMRIDPGRGLHILGAKATREFAATSLEDVDDLAGLSAVPSQAVYMCFTSGSTGKPKGVVVTHRGIAGRLTWTVRRHELGAQDRVLQKTSVAFDAAMWEIFAPLVSGGTLVMAPPRVEADAARLVECIADRRITVFQTVPSVLALLAREPRWIECQSLRLLFSAGEPLHELLAREATQGITAELWNTYGPTECSIDVTAHLVDGEIENGVPIGHPIDGVRVHVLDQELKPVPDGLVGELFIGGPALARGYQGRPDLTADRFLPDPAGGGARIYRTGDLVRRRADGELQILGRVDDQVKVNGIRIEPSEIEMYVRAHPDVRDCVVLAQGEPKALVVHAECSQRLTIHDLRDRLTGSLPSGILPAHLERWRKLPRTISGKHDRMAMRAIDLRPNIRRSREVIEPMGEHERLIATLWRDALGVSTVSRDDDFFQIGGSSLQLAGLARNLQVAGHSVTAAQLFLAPTVTDQASLLEQAGQHCSQSVARIERRPDGVYQASSAQRRMWFLDRLRPGDPEWVTPIFLRLSSCTDEAQIRSALERLQARHATLRTTYTEKVGAVDQVISPAGESIELTVVPDWAPLVERVREHLSVGFDLEHGSMWRSLLVNLPGTARLLVVACHHIAVDGWSSVILERELRALLDGVAIPEPPTLEYIDYAAWELQSASAVGDLGYWEETLADVPPLELPTCHPRPPERDSRGQLFELSISPRTAESISAIGQAAGASPSMTFLACFAATIATFAEQEDFCVGSPVAGRDVAGTADVVGMFLNVVALRLRVDRSCIFSELVSDVARVSREAFAHQSQPFDAVIDRCDPTRDLSRTPLFQVAYDFHEEGETSVGNSKLDVDGLGEAWGVSRTDLTMIVNQRSNRGLDIHLEYAVGLFSRGFVEGFGECFVGLLEGLVEGGGSVCVGDVVGRSGGVPGGGDGVVFPVSGGLVDGFVSRMGSAPDSVAVVAGDVRVSYRELSGRVFGLARRLRALGVGRGSLVGVCLPRSVDSVVAVLGVLASGAGYVPMDPVVPVERLRFMAEDSGVGVLVTSGSVVGVVDEFFAGPRVLMDDSGIGEVSGVPFQVGVVPEDVAYVMYTSGSTGRPKGVCVTHGNVLRLLAAGESRFGFDESDVWPWFHSFAFDVSVWEMWGALLFGGRLVVVDQDVVRSPDEFLDVLVKHRVTILNQTPSAFKRLLPSVGSGDPRWDEVSLRAVVFAGEKLAMSDLREWVGRFGVRSPLLVNMYGITEVTVHGTFYAVTEEDVESGWLNPIGMPLPDMRIHVLDGRGRPVPVGAPGEMYVGGPGVTTGYWQRADLTADRFVPDPFDEVPGARLYRSGDRARWLPGGGLEFLGRADDQVKIRGYRIEPGEVRSVLVEAPMVADAAVVVRDDVGEGGALVAYVVPTSAGEIVPPDQVRAFVGARVPEYMVPAAVVTVAMLPLTVNGKLDTRALPAPDREHARDGHHYVPPHNPAQQHVTEIYTDILGVDRVSIHDNFFTLGGNSMSVVKLVGRLRTSGFDVSVRDVFESPTPAALVSVTESRGPVGTESRVERFALLALSDRARLPDRIVDAYPLSHIQAAMVAEMLSSASANYHNTTSFRIRDDVPLHVDVLRRAVDLVVQRHEALRTSIHVSSYSEPLQVVHAEARMSLRSVNLSGLDDEHIDLAIRSDMERERAAVFDLEEAPLVRLVAHQCDGTVWWLTITECHAVIEGWSHHSLLMEVLDAYRCLRDEGAVPGFVHPGVRFADFIALERKAVESTKHRDHWAEVVADTPRLELPTSWGDPDLTERQEFMASMDYADLEPELRAIADRVGASVKSVLLAAHLATLGAITDQENFLTGLVQHGRPEVEGADRVYGMFLNSLPVRHERTATTWLELISQVHAQEREVWEHRHYPLPLIQGELAGGQRLVDVRFSYHDFDMVDHKLVDYGASIDDSPTEFPLAVLVRLKRIFLLADERSIRRPNVERLLRLYRSALVALTTDPESDPRAGHADDISATPRPPVLAQGWSGTVYDRFRHYAALTPRATAVLGPDGEVSYAELHSQASDLAVALRDRGVRPGAAVGVQVRRGPALLRSMLAVWACRAAYVPIDPEAPPARVRAVLAAAGCDVLLAAESSFAEGNRSETVVLDPSAPHANEATSAPEGCPTAQDAAYIVFTSGSTGEPKGVSVDHASLANHIRWAGTDLMRTPGGAPLFSSHAFDLVVPTLFAPLAVGERIVCLDSDLDLGDLAERLIDHAPFSFIKLTPSHLTMLSQQLSPGRLLAETIVVAGEPLDSATVAKFREVHPSGRIINEYGPTETTVGACVHEVAEEAGAVPIGESLPGMSMYVLDARQQPVPFGVRGELYVGGVGVAHGYVGDVRKTAERFVPDPFGAHGSRMYRTGDIVSQRSDGQMVFHGRADNQIKIRGYRVEPDEVAVRLRAHPLVSDAVVVPLVRDGVVDGLTAYVVTQTDDAAMRDHCAATLPDYLVPTHFIRLEHLPLNRNGKVDRQALPSPDSTLEREFIAPRTDTERTIAEIWREVLDIEEVGVEDNFFDIGGHSIRAVAVVGRLRAAGLDVGVNDVFRNRTIAALARRVESTESPDCQRTLTAPYALLGQPDAETLPADVIDAYPMSRVQLGMVVESLAADGGRYHNCSTIFVPDERPVDHSALRVAADVLVARHEILRTTFDLENFTKPLQLVHREARIPLILNDVRGETEERQRASIRSYIEHERSHMFELSHAPLLRFRVHRCEKGWWLSITICHALTEGWSLQQLVTEFIEFYHAEVDGRPAHVPDLPDVRYADFIAAEQEAIESSVHTDYWKSVVASTPRFVLPHDWGVDNAPTFVRAVPIADLADRLRAVATECDASLKSVLHAAHLMALARLTYDSEFYTGLVVSARPEIEGSERVPGMYLNTVPFRFNSAESCWREAIRQVYENEQEVWEHRAVPGPVIAASAGPGRMLDTMFSYRELDSDNARLLANDGGEVIEGANEFPLAVSTLGGALVLTCDGRIIGEDRAEYLVQLHRAALESVARGGAEPVNFDVVEDDDWNDTDLEWA